MNKSKGHVLKKDESTHMPLYYLMDYSFIKKIDHLLCSLIN